MTRLFGAFVFAPLPLGLETSIHGGLLKVLRRRQGQLQLDNVLTHCC